MEQVKVLIFQPNVLCYKFAILWLRGLRRVRQCQHDEGCGDAMVKKEKCEADIKKCGGCLVVEKVKVLIFQPNILCYKYAIMWLLCLGRARQYQHVKGCGGALVEK